MPNVVTHGLMALDVYNQLTPSYIKRSIAKHPKAYLLGSNGPDILFYYNVFPWQDQTLNQKVSDYGHAVHSSHINAFYDFGLKHILSIKDEERSAILLSYFAGHLQHWALDSIAHPFVFYRSGALEGKTRYHHYRYESMIDALMVTYVKRRRLQDLHAKRMVDVSEEECRVIATFYQTVLKEVFGIYDEVEVFESSIQAMKKMMNVLYDPYHIKFPVIQAYENASKKPWAFTSHVVSSRLDRDYDVLNLKHEQWSNPTDITDTSTQSFVDLYNESIELGIQTLHYLDKAVESGIFDFEKLLHGKRYDTGRLEGIEMRYYDSIYLK